MEGTAGPKLEVLHHRGPRRTLRVTKNDQFSVSFNLGTELAARLALNASAAAASARSSTSPAASVPPSAHSVTLAATDATAAATATGIKKDVSTCIADGTTTDSASARVVPDDWESLADHGAAAHACMY